MAIEEVTMEYAMGCVRSSRDYMLATYVDYYQSKPMLWNGLTAEQQQELADYRQALLDWPETLQEIYGDVPPNSYAKHQPSQPQWFESHPRGIMFP